MKLSEVCRDALDNAFEVSKLLWFSPKRNAALDRIKVENPEDGDAVYGPNHRVQSFCPNRWTVRVESILENYNPLKDMSFTLGFPIRVKNFHTTTR